MVACCLPAVTRFCAPPLLFSYTTAFCLPQVSFALVTSLPRGHTAVLPPPARTAPARMRAFCRSGFCVPAPAAASFCRQVYYHACHACLPGSAWTRLACLTCLDGMEDYRLGAAMMPRRLLPLYPHLPRLLFLLPLGAVPRRCHVFLVLPAAVTPWVGLPACLHKVYLGLPAFLPGCTAPACLPGRYCTCLLLFCRTGLH